MLFLAIHYLTGRAVATAFDERDQAEWPPHPARVFSMLVAAHHESGGDPPERAALEWLQQQPPPSLVASEAQHRAVPIHYVPVNDAVLPREGALGVAGLSKAQLSQGMQLLPEHRLRQPRIFPTVIPDDATVHVCWPNDPPEVLRPALRTLAAAATRLGHSSSLVDARWVDEGPLPTWVPDANGSETFRVPGEDQLAALEDAHARWLATGRRTRLP